jgi:hypothetical protein
MVAVLTNVIDDKQARLSLRVLKIAENGTREGAETRMRV